MENVTLRRIYYILSNIAETLMYRCLITAVAANDKNNFRITVTTINGNAKNQQNNTFL